MFKVLVCDDESGMREMLTSCLKRAGYEVVAVESFGAATRALQGQSFDLVLTDLSLPDGTGMDLLQQAKELDSTMQVVMITGYATSEQAVVAMRMGAYDYIRKPFRNSELLVVLEKALEKRILIGENRSLRARTLGQSPVVGMVGNSRAIRAVQELIAKASPSRTNVLITGESGTGKEVAARAIHDLSDRSKGPFVVVNCGAIPENLIESELFGHEKGAFTGAQQKHDGMFRAADGGTLFLDEVGELPLVLQVKLLRALQERRIKSVGGTKELEVDVRVVAATNRVLEDEVAQGRFRADLFYRLNVIRIQMPPLRERPDDIPLLAEHLLGRHVALQGKKIRLGPSAMRALMSLPFAGNVRELENTIERAVALTDREELTAQDFDVHGIAQDAPLTLPTVGPEGGFDIDAYLSDIERRLLQQALTACQGNQTAAAKALGTSFRSIRYRLKKYGLVSDDSGEVLLDDKG